MSRRFALMVLCEDCQQEAFVRRFLKREGWDLARCKVEKAPDGRNGEQFVRERFPKELKAHRKLLALNKALLVVTDGDAVGREERHKRLTLECDKQGVKAPKPDERVALFLPTWNIETWLAYLDGETVSEKRGDYPRYPGRESDCRRHVTALQNMCEARQLREPAPESLQASCDEYQRLKSLSPNE